MGLLDRLKKSRGQNVNALQNRLASNGQGGSSRDDRFWKWTFNEDNISSSVIRFLPIPMVDMQKEEDGGFDEGAVLTPCALIKSHYFQGPSGQYYRENSPETFGEDCPVRIHDSPLWKAWKENGKDEGVKKVLLNRISKEDYIANILVINDEQNPENNGKVMLFKFGRAVKKLLDKAAKPDFATDPKIDDVFCAYEGANLVLNIVGEKRKFGQWEGVVPSEWGKCSWQASSPLAETDEEIEKIWGQTHSIMEFYDRKHFKSYEELEAKFKKVMGIPEDMPLVAQNNEAQAPAQQQDVPDTRTSAAAMQQADQQQKEAAQQQAPTNVGTPNQTPADESAGGGDDLDDFERMLQEAD